MVPVRVRVIGSCPCTVADASALIQRFLCSDACSDSFARDYVVNVAHAFESRRSTEPECGRGSSQQHQSTSKKISLSPDGGAASPESFSKLHRRKQKHYAIENGSILCEEESVGKSIDTHPTCNEKKRKKEEEQDRLTRYVSIQKHRRGLNRQGTVELEKEGNAVDSQKVQNKKRRKMNHDSNNTEDAENIMLPEALSIKDTWSAKRKSFVESAEASTVSFASLTAENDGIEWLKKRAEADSGLLDLHVRGLYPGLQPETASTSAFKSLSPGEGKKKNKQKKTNG